MDMAASSMRSGAVGAVAGGGPRRRPQNGGYARGDEVQSRILLAAIKLFGEQGFASASTRAIAADAGVNPPALQYYFHNKERLHQACGQYIVDRIKRHLELPMRRVSETLASRDREAVPQTLWLLMETVVDRSADETDIPGWARFMNQAAVEAVDTSVALIHREAVLPMCDAIAALLALAWDRPADDEAARLGAVLLLNQTRAFGIQRDITMAMMAWPDFHQGRLGLGKHFLRSQMLSVIASPFTAQAEPRP
jgi:AcrR family transcriptional regulator